jgi:hypothetical protein
MDVELTADDKRNGWTLDALKKYLADREKGQASKVDMDNRSYKPQQQVPYNPLRWRE